MTVIFCVIAIAAALVYASHVQVHELDRDTRKELNDEV